MLNLKGEEESDYGMMKRSQRWDLGKGSQWSATCRIHTPSTFKILTHFRMG